MHNFQTSLLLRPQLKVSLVVKRATFLSSSNWWAPGTVFFETVHPVYPVLDKPSFRSTWPQLYEQNSTTSDRDLLSAFYLVVAVGEVNRKLPAPGEALPQLYQKSWTMLQDCLAVPNVSTVQILLLHVSKISSHVCILG